MKTNEVTGKHTARRWLLGFISLFSASAFADSLERADDILCYGLTATICTIDNKVCESKEPWELNLPDFVDVDLRAKLLKSTNAAHEERQTPIARLERLDGRIFLQGSQGDRAFSWVMSEQTGEGSIMINTFDSAVTVFTVCTPR